nr:hypothetical protein [Tanacetum cinerariifolium]
MADLAFAPRYNMVAYLEKTENNAEFHQIVNFHRSSSIHHALTIHATVDGRGNNLVRDVTAANLDAQQESSNIAKTQSKGTLNEPNPQGEGSGSGPGYQETMQGAIAQLKHEGASIQFIDPPLSTCHTVRSREDRMEREFELIDLVPQTPHDSPLSGGYTPGSDKGNMTPKELMDLCTTFSQKEVNLDADTEVIVEDKGSGEKGGSTAETVSTTRPNISATRPEVSSAEPKTPPTTTTFFDDEDVTIANTLVKMKNQKAKEKGVTFEDTDDSARPIRSITTLQPLPTIDPKDKDLNKEVWTERERQKEASKAALAELYDESRSFKEIQKLHNKEQKCVDAFVPIGSKEDEKRIGSRKKRAVGSSSKQKSPKKQKVNDQESDDSDKELRKCLKMAPDYDKPINYETLDVKSPIVDYESQVLGTMVAGDVHVYKLTRLDKSYKHFSTFSRMLEALYRQDVLDLHKIVMEKFLDSDPEEKRYPLTKEILEKIISWRLEAETKSTLALDLIKFIKLLLEEK